VLHIYIYDISNLRVKAVQAECVPAVFCSGIMHSQLSLVLELNEKMHCATDDIINNYFCAGC